MYIRTMHTHSVSVHGCLLEATMRLTLQSAIDSFYIEEQQRRGYAEQL